MSSPTPEQADSPGLPLDSGDPVESWSAEHWREATDWSPLALFVVDPSAATCGEIRYANRAGAELLARIPVARRQGNAGTTASVFDMLSEADRPVLTELLFELGSNGQTTERSGAATRRTAEVTIVAGTRKDDLGEDRYVACLGPGPENSVIVQLVSLTPAPLSDEALTQQQRFRSALMELSELADSTSDDDEFYQRLIERAVEVVPGAQSGSVQLHVPGTAAFRFVAASGFDLAGLQLHELERDSFFRDAWDPTARIVRDFGGDGRSDEVTEWLETWGRLSEIVVNVSAPVLVDGLPVAFLSLDNFDDPDAFTETSVEMTTVLSRLIGTLWRRRHLESELREEREAFRHEAMHDSLTALPNRRNVERLMSDGLESARRRGHPSAVLFLDIDDFKGVNDRLGHEAGDLLLIGVAKALQEVVRLGDVVGRWGGDEFLVLPQRLEAPAAAEALADRILTRFERDLVLDSGLSYRARLSIGIGWSLDSTADCNALISTADDALYEAKAAGKGIARIRSL